MTPRHSTPDQSGIAPTLCGAPAPIRVDIGLMARRAMSRFIGHAVSDAGTIFSWAFRQLDPSRRVAERPNFRTPAVRCVRVAANKHQRQWGEAMRAILAAL